MNFSSWRRILLLGAPLLLGACGPPRRAPETAATARLKDSAPERAAAQRAAAGPGLTLEADDQRWGIGAAQERKRARDEQAARAKALAGVGSATVDVAPVPGAPRGHIEP